MIKRGDPSFTEADAASLVRRVTPDQIAKLQSTAYGADPAATAAEALNDEAVAERIRASGGTPPPKGQAPRTGGAPSKD